MLKITKSTIYPFLLLLLLGCSKKKEDVVPQPTADFTSSTQSIETGQTVTFTNSSENATSYAWVFEGGTPDFSTEENPIVTYNVAGNYDVRLEAVNDAGSAVDSRTGFITVVDPTPDPVAGFTFSTDVVGEGNSITYNNTSTGATSFHWSFEGGTPSTSTERNPTVTYNSAGKYGATLTAANSDGVTDTETKSSIITVYAYATAAFTADKTTVGKGLTVKYTNQSSNATSYSWTFEGGTPATSTEANPTVTYNSPGQYDVSLVASNQYSNDTESKSNFIDVDSYLAFLKVYYNGAIGYSYNGTGGQNTVTKIGTGVYDIKMQGIGNSGIGHGSGDIQVVTNAGSRAFSSINYIQGGGDTEIKIKTFDTYGNANDESFFLTVNLNVSNGGGFALIDNSNAIAYSYNSTGGEVATTIPSGGGTGRKEVIFGGLSMEGKNVQISTLSGPRNTVFEKAESNYVDIATFDKDGNPANSSYVMVAVNAPEGKGAYGNFAGYGDANTEYDASSNSYNSTGGRNYVVRSGFGVYDVYFEGFDLNSPHTIQVTPIYAANSAPRTVTVQSVNTYSNGVVIRVLVYNETGAADLSNLSVYLKYDD